MRYGLAAPSTVHYSRRKAPQKCSDNEETGHGTLHGRTKVELIFKGRSGEQASYNAVVVA